MVETLLSNLQNKIILYKTELFIILFAAIPTSLFIVFAWIKGDFLVLDHSYWIGVVAYNLVLFYGIWLAWTKKTLKLSEGILYVGIAITLILYTAFREIIFTGDITQGVITGARMLWEGKNPYVVAEVPHAQPYPPGGFRYETYAYLPVDLLSYAVLLGSLNFISTIIAGTEIPVFLPGFNEMGILVANLALMCVSIYLLKDILEIRWKKAVALGVFLFLILIWNNVCLAQTFFIAGWYFHKREQTNLVIFFWSLSMLSKYFAGIFIVAYIVEYLRKQENMEVLIKSVIAGVLSIVVSLPFGIMNVLNSTVFFYNTEERILDGSFGGSIFSEIILFLQLEDIIWLFTIVGFSIILIIAIVIDDLFQRLVITSCLALFVITGISAQFLVVITLILIISGQIQLFEGQKQYSRSEISNPTN
ncbi:MAG: hypothetical protein ACW98G_05745 [Candidatus Hodarchaeales archaeon]|jgi:hypothetical protein